MSLKDHIYWAEGVRRFPYEDTVGKTTIGVGRNLDDVGLSADEIAFLFRNDLTRAQHDAASLPYFDRLDCVRAEAVVDLVFNMGLPRWRGFIRANEALAVGDYEWAAREIEDSKYFRQTKRRGRRVRDAIRDGVWYPTSNY